MKTKRFRSSYRQNSSKLHKRVGDVLRNSKLFAGFKIYQEYPVNKINPAHLSGRHAFDWVILDLFLVIECHGEQHYRPVAFGGISQDEAIERFTAQCYRDNIKADAAIEAGFTYVVIPFTDYSKVDANYIWKLYKEYFNESPIPKYEKGEKTEYELKMQERAREYRRDKYRRDKQLLDEIKQGRRGDGL